MDVETETWLPRLWERPPIGALFKDTFCAIPRPKAGGKPALRLRRGEAPWRNRRGWRRVGLGWVHRIRTNFVENGLGRSGQSKTSIRMDLTDPPHFDQKAWRAGCTPSRMRGDKCFRPRTCQLRAFRGRLGRRPLKFTALQLAPEVGLEPTTPRLTAACSTIELLWNPSGRAIYKPPSVASNGFSTKVRSERILTEPPNIGAQASGLRACRQPFRWAGAADAGQPRHSANTRQAGSSTTRSQAEGLRP